MTNVQTKGSNDGILQCRLTTVEANVEVECDGGLQRFITWNPVQNLRTMDASVEADCDGS
jgi:hypothetical protein